MNPTDVFSVLTSPQGEMIQTLAPVMNSGTIEDMVQNAMLTRHEFLSRFLDPRRNIDSECGYPDATAITIQDYRRLYYRDPVANRAISLMPSESWIDSPTVFETEDPEEETDFELAWDAISTELGGRSWHDDSEESAVWNTLYEADTLAGIGRYGVLWLGFDDGTDPREPIEAVEREKPDSKKRKLKFLRAFDETCAQISQVENDPTHVRFGLPTLYNLTLIDLQEQEQGLTFTNSATVQVHWTRIIHIVDGKTSRSVISIPRLRPILNRIMDLHKLYGGSAEMYWKGAFPGISIETNPQMGPNVNIDKAAMKGQMENYFNSLQRYLSLVGMQAKTLSPTVVDPSQQIKVHLEGISIGLNCPMRIFMGSERGELSSGQDADAWSQRVSGRRSRYLIPGIITPFVDRLILAGVLPEPESYKAQWDGDPGLSDTEKSTLAKTRAETLNVYLSGNLSSLMTPTDFLVREMGYSDEEATSILEAATEASKVAETEAAAKAEQEAKVAAKSTPPTPPPTAPGTPPGKVPPKPAPKPGEGNLKPSPDVKGPKAGTADPTDNKFNSNQPRNSKGQWGGGGGASAAVGGGKETVFAVTQNKETKQWEGADGEPAPEHIQQIAIPPSWKDVFANPDPDGTVMVKGMDSKEQVQTLYSKTHTAQAAQAKFARVTELREKRSEIFKELDRDAKDPKLKDQADCLKVVMQTGMRPGGSATKSVHESFGATSLQGRHVIANNDGTVTLRLVTGKNKGREVDFQVRDKETAKMLITRAKDSGEDGQMFPTTSATKLRAYSKSKDGGGFKTKDHRTALGTETAIEAIKKLPPPRTQKEYDAHSKVVAISVAETLGNTPAVALKSYIDPVVFSVWSPETLP